MLILTNSKILQIVEIGKKNVRVPQPNPNIFLKNAFQVLTLGNNLTLADLHKYEVLENLHNLATYIQTCIGKFENEDILH